jgi:hypothetical protein
VLLAIAGCSRHHPAPGESVSEACQLAHDRQAVAISGYLAAPRAMVGCTTTCNLELVETPSGRDGLSLRFPVGAGPRTMSAIAARHAAPGQVPAISTDQMRLVSDEGTAVTPGDVVRVRGIVEVHQLDGQLECSMAPSSVVVVP